MELSIIITNYKQPELLKLCLESIRKNLTLKDYEIIVSDCETENDTAMMMREDFPKIKFVASLANIGFGATVKNGYEKAKGEYILILNGDIIVKKNSIENLLEYFKSKPDVGIVGPQLLSFNETIQPSCFRYYTPLTIIYRRTFLGKLKLGKKHVDKFLMKDFDKKTPREVDWIQGSAMLTSRKAVSAVGLMDKRFKMYFEDVDWCRRFWKKGYKVIYYPHSQMYHYHGRGSAGQGVLKTLFSKRLAWLHIASAAKYFWKYRGQTTPKHQ